MRGNKLIWTFRNKQNKRQWLSSKPLWIMIIDSFYSKKNEKFWEILFEVPSYSEIRASGARCMFTIHGSANSIAHYSHSGFPAIYLSQIFALIFFSYHPSWLIGSVLRIKNHHTICYYDSNQIGWFKGFSFSISLNEFQCSKHQYGLRRFIPRRILFQLPSVYLEHPLEFGMEFFDPWFGQWQLFLEECDGSKVLKETSCSDGSAEPETFSQLALQKLIET